MPINKIPACLFIGAVIEIGSRLLLVGFFWVGLGGAIALCWQIQFFFGNGLGVGSKFAFCASVVVIFAGRTLEMLVYRRLRVMAIEEEKQEVDDNALLDEGLSAEGADPEFLSYLEESQNEFEGWLERVRDRRERSVSVLDEVRGDLGRSRSWLDKLQGKEEKSDRQDKSYADKSKR